MFFLLLLLLAWLLLNELAPLALLYGAKREHPMPWALIRRARFYSSEKLTGGIACSCVVGPYFIIMAHPRVYTERMDLVLAHEIGHCVLGHLRWRWLAQVTGAALLPWVQRRVAKFEGEANDWAFALMRRRENERTQHGSQILVP